MVLVRGSVMPGTAYCSVPEGLGRNIRHFPTAEAVGFLVLRPGRAGVSWVPIFPPLKRWAFLCCARARRNVVGSAFPSLKRWAFLCCAQGAPECHRFCFPTAEAVGFLTLRPKARRNFVR